MLVVLAFLVALIGAVAYVVVMSRELTGRVRLVKVVPALALAVPLARVHPALGLGYVAWAGGDFFLLDKQKGFVAGLASFLVGHLLVVLGSGPLPQAGLAGPAFLGALLLTGVGMVGALWRGLRGPLKVAVPLYTGALVAMAVTVGARDLAAFAGGLSFVLSDAVLAWQKFRSRLPFGDHVVILTYYLAVGLVAAGLLRAGGVG